MQMATEIQNQLHLKNQKALLCPRNLIPLKSATKIPLNPALALHKSLTVLFFQSASDPD